MDSKLAKASHLAQILTFVLTCWLLVRPASWNPWSNPFDTTVKAYSLPIFLGLCLLLAAALNMAAVMIGKRTKDKDDKSSTEGIDAATHQRTVDDLTTCQSELKHWKGEVEREQLLRKEQVEIRDAQIGEQGGRIGNLEQQLRVSQNTVDSLRDQLSAPNGRFKLKKVRYVATESRSLELRDFGKLPEKDLTEFFEDKYLENGKLIIPPGLYRKLFGPLNDPLVGVPKLLEIRFVHAGNEMSVLLPENISITLPFPYGVTTESMT